MHKIVKQFVRAMIIHIDIYKYNLLIQLHEIKPLTVAHKYSIFNIQTQRPNLSLAKLNYSYTLYHSWFKFINLKYKIPAILFPLSDNYKLNKKIPENSAVVDGEGV